MEMFLKKFMLVALIIPAVCLTGCSQINGVESDFAGTVIATTESVNDTPMFDSYPAKPGEIFYLGQSVGINANEYETVVRESRLCVEDPVTRQSTLLVSPAVDLESSNQDVYSWMLECRATVAIQLMD